MYSFKLIKYIIYDYIFNITKSLKGQYANKLTTPMLAAYNCKMSTNNMIKYKGLEYTCFRIYNVDV